jgi:hypothetical protein
MLLVLVGPKLGHRLEAALQRLERKVHHADPHVVIHLLRVLVEKAVTVLERLDLP